jgi:hypothetical protein
MPNIALATKLDCSRVADCNGGLLSADLCKNEPPAGRARKDILPEAWAAGVPADIRLVTQDTWFSEST